MIESPQQDPLETPGDPSEEEGGGGGGEESGGDAGEGAE